ncbi:uncharacterized protein K452DRAFT_39269 [Aplosporella prunicola CBS 121167]|uniref:Secreted protein n=1 Tax=Aplosporella prunicola CBS 121167 TaxID=1176127 RepID=A0A6A6BCT4_9PEZI|nr:uncharacterized protein K452DRAFT_39269 [Aplosporella prunicola CBS 121167]KAF2141418.1 hypothetical protein K452DRAFT_39269 [Aplosporella prunicola CBS 121167]
MNEPIPSLRAIKFIAHFAFLAIHVSCRAQPRPGLRTTERSSHIHTGKDRVVSSNPCVQPLRCAASQPTSLILAMPHSHH